MDNQHGELIAILKRRHGYFKSRIHVVNDIVSWISGYRQLAWDIATGYIHTLEYEEWIVCMTSYLLLALLLMVSQYNFLALMHDFILLLLC